MWSEVVTERIIKTVVTKKDETTHNMIVEQLKELRFQNGYLTDLFVILSIRMRLQHLRK